MGFSFQSWARKLGKGRFSQALAAAAVARCPELGELCEGDKTTPSMRKPSCQAMAASLEVLGSPEQPPPQPNEIPEKGFFGGVLALLYVSQRWMGGSGCKPVWVTIGPHQRRSHLVRTHLTLREVMKGGCVREKNTVKDSASINPRS